MNEMSNLKVWSTMQKFFLEFINGKERTLFSSTRLMEGKGLFSDDHVSVALDVTQLVAVKVDHQLSQSRPGGGEVNFHFSVFTRSHRGIQPVR